MGNHTMEATFLSPAPSFWCWKVTDFRRQVSANNLPITSSLSPPTEICINEAFFQPVCYTLAFEEIIELAVGFERLKKKLARMQNFLLHSPWTCIKGHWRACLLFLKWSTFTVHWLKCIYIWCIQTGKIAGRVCQSTRNIIHNCIFTSN